MVVSGRGGVVVSKWFLLLQAGLSSKIQETFNCIVCQEVVYQPVTTSCGHNICKVSTTVCDLQCK